MITYLFHQAGSIPGIPGTFANVRVDVADDGSLAVKPLYPIAAITAEITDDRAVVEPSVEAQQAPIVSEQVEALPVADQTVPLPHTNGG